MSTHPCTHHPVPAAAAPAQGLPPRQPRPALRSRFLYTALAATAVVLTLAPATALAAPPSGGLAPSVGSRTGLSVATIGALPGSSRADVPSPSAIARVMATTVEAGDPSEHFAPSSAPVTVADGSGGYLTAVIGTRSPSADGYGQLVFFWHGTTFVGWDRSSESLAIQAITPGKPGAIRVTYAHYGPDDGLCCPSLPAVTIEYRWNGHGFTPSGMPPKRGEEAAVEGA